MSFNSGQQSAGSSVPVRFTTSAEDPCAARLRFQEGGQLSRKFGLVRQIDAGRAVVNCANNGLLVLIAVSARRMSVLGLGVAMYETRLASASRAATK